MWQSHKWVHYDFLIAAAAVTRGYAVLSADRDFGNIARITLRNHRLLRKNMTREWRQGAEMTGL
jgi:hypothetical protein